MVMGTSHHASADRYFAPACVYTEIPPASLSTLDVISPGPMTASKSVNRCRNARIRFCKSFPRDFSPSTRVVIASQFMAFLNLVLFSLLHYFNQFNYFLTSRETTSSTVLCSIGRP